jgi:hypothetical protein
MTDRTNNNVRNIDGPEQVAETHGKEPSFSLPEARQLKTKMIELKSPPYQTIQDSDGRIWIVPKGSQRGTPTDVPRLLEKDKDKEIEEIPDEPRKRGREKHLIDLDDEGMNNPISSQDKYVRSPSRSSNSSRRSSVDRLYQLSSNPYQAVYRPQTPEPGRRRNSFVISKYLNIDERDFDPLFFSIPNVLKDEITARQREISSDWPLLTTPPLLRKERNKTLYEKGVVQAQISNAVQMALSMLLQGDHSAAIVFLLDAYALATQAATEINNNRVTEDMPLAKEYIDNQMAELVRPKVKEILLGAKSSESIKNFFRTGGGTNFPSQHHQQQQEDDSLMDPYDREDLPDRRSRRNRGSFSEDQKEFARDFMEMFKEVFFSQGNIQGRFNQQKPFNKSHRSRQQKFKISGGKKYPKYAK